MNKARVNYRMIIGTNEDISRELDLILGDLTHILGGVTLTKGTGTWSDGGEDFVDDFSGRSFEVETAYIIDASVEESRDGSELREQLRAPFVALMGKANWVHMERTESMAYHFAIDDIA